MAVKCIAIRMTHNGYHHEHISEIQWVQDGSSDKAVSTREKMVEWIEGGGKAYVKDAKGDIAYLGVRVSSLGNKYVQTYADGIWTDNLLALPRF